jgi:hypothetical protein
MKKITIVISFFLVMTCGLNYLSAAMNSGNYQIWQDAISVGGGEDQASSNYNLDDTLGEFAVGRSSSTNYGLKSGFREVQFFEGEQVLSLSVSPSSLEFGNLATDSTGSGSISLTVDTNSPSGVSVTYSGNTLTCASCSGTNTISAIGSSSASSSQGSSQFGFNAIYSSGSAPVASATSNYSTSGQYAFSSGSEIISSSGAINSTVFTLNFIANISGDETSGTYSTTIVYTATASF